MRISSHSQVPDRHRQVTAERAQPPNRRSLTVPAHTLHMAHLRGAVK